MNDDLLREAKAQLRNSVLAARNPCGDGHSDQLIEYVRSRQLRTVAAYVNFGSEPSTAKFLHWARVQGVLVLLPRIMNDTELDWHEYNANQLTVGSLGMSEPSGRSVALSEAQAIFVPALAAGLDGSRLGRGRGFYDRALQSISSPVIALVHDNEVFDSVPHESHDVPVAAIISCSKTVELN